MGELACQMRTWKNQFIDFLRYTSTVPLPNPEALGCTELELLNE